MSIYKGESNALLLKNDRSVAELYKGNTKIFGYNNKASGEVISIDNAHPIEHKIRVSVKSKNLVNNHTAYAVNTTPESLNGAIITDEYIDLTHQGTYTYVYIPISLKAGKTYTAWYEVDVYERKTDDTSYTYISFGFYGDARRRGFNKTTIYYETVTYTPTEDIDTKMVVIANHGSPNPAKVRFKIMVVEGEYTLNTIPAFTPYVDVSTLALYRGGENILAYPYHHGSITTNGITWTVNSDGSITANGTATSQSYFYLKNNISLQSGTVFVRGLGEAYEKGISMCFNNIGYVNADDKTLTIPEGYDNETLYLFVKSGTTVDNVLIKPPFACYNDDDIVKEYSVNSDGAVEGITSASPNMTLMTDTDGAIIECEYVGGDG